MVVLHSDYHQQYDISWGWAKDLDDSKFNSLLQIIKENKERIGNNNAHSSKSSDNYNSIKLGRDNEKDNK